MLEIKTVKLFHIVLRPAINHQQFCLRVILQKRPEEERIHDLAVATHKEKIAETQVFRSLPKERKINEKLIQIPK